MTQFDEIDLIQEGPAVHSGAFCLTAFALFWKLSKIVGQDEQLALRRQLPTSLRYDLGIRPSEPAATLAKGQGAADGPAPVR